MLFLSEKLNDPRIPGKILFIIAMLFVKKVQPLF